MKKILTCIVFAVVAIVMAATTTSCKKTNPDVESLCNIAKAATANGEQKLPNGMTLTKCNFNEGDTVFTYFIKVEDGRLDNVPVDSLKSTVAADLKNDEAKKLTSILKKNNFGLKYVYDTPKKVMTVFFASSEL